MKTRIKWTEGVSFVAETASGHALVLDGAPEAGGRNLGPRPMELVLAGTAACTAFDVVWILKKARQSITDCVVEAEAERAVDDPRVFTHIHLKYRVVGKGLKRAQVERAVTLMGGAGSGQLTKMVNQICIAGLVQGLSEGINFGIRAGLDIEQVLDVIGKGAAQSWQMDNRGKTMAADKFDFGFAVDWMRKDLAICFAEARANGAALPVTAIVDQFYARIQARGGRRWDTSSLIRLLRDSA